MTKDAYKHNPGYGSIFKNTRREKKSQPVFRGEFALSDELIDAADNHDGRLQIALFNVYDESGELKLDRNGNKMYSLKVSEPFSPEKGAANNTSKVDDALDDDEL